MGSSWQNRVGASNSCGKVAYLSRKAAKLNGSKLHNGASKGRMRPYRCPVCDLWHVGHLPRVVIRGFMTAGEAYGRVEVEMAPGQRPVDMTEGIFTPSEVASIFHVSPTVVYTWCRNYQEGPTRPHQGKASIAAFRTAEGQWRISGRAVREALEAQEETEGQHDGNEG